MIVLHHEKRSGFARADLLVTILLAIVALSLLSCGLSTSRISSLRSYCVNNLMQIGIAIHTYHDANSNLPSETPTAPGKTGPESFYIYLLPYVEEQYNAPAASQPVRLFLCPSRRSTAVGGKRDYGYGCSKGAGSVGTSVLDAPEFLTLDAIQDQKKGTSKTALLSHVWLDPKTYKGGDPTDLGWNTLNNGRSCNTNLSDTDATGSNTAIGSPHPNVNIFLFVDAHVQNIPYGWQPSEGPFANIWAYDSKQDITLP